MVRASALADAITPGGPEGLRSLTNPKAVVVDRWPWLFETKIPWLLDYPIRSSLRAWCVLTFSYTLKQNNVRGHVVGRLQVV